MNAVLKIFLSMSLSGGLLILALLLGKRFLKNKISRQWQYYIWLVVVLRLMLPFGPEVSLLGKTYQAFDLAITQAALLPQQQPSTNISENVTVPSATLEQNDEKLDGPTEDLTVAHPLQDIGVLLTNHVWLLWLTIALGMLMRKVTIYQGFLRYIKAGMTPVSDIEILDRLSIVAEQSDVKRPIELCVNPIISSPMLIGVFHPYIVLPSADVSEKDFQYIVLHELTHYKRWDMFYKWLVQVTVCLHWFNPLVYLMSREITKACEFSCDEAVLTKIGCNNAQDYGKTLLDAMAAVGKYKENFGAVTLSENKQLLKERIGAIMDFEKKSTAIRLLTCVLTLCVMFGSAFIGVYPVAAATNISKPTNIVNPLPAQTDGSPVMETLDIKGTTYYLVCNEAQLRAIGTGEYGMEQSYIQQANIQLSTDEWIPIGTWDNPFTGTFNGNGFEIVGLTMTDPDADIIGLFGVAKAANIYNVTLRDYDIMSAGRNISGKSIGAILAVGQGSQSYDNLVYPKETGADIDRNVFPSSPRSDDWDDEFGWDWDWGNEEEKDKAWDETQRAEYQATGVTVDGKNYYYQGQLVNVFLDIRANKSFYTLDTNPAGTVSIKIIRDADNKITDVAYMTEAEVTELLEDMADPDDEWADGQEITIPIEIVSVRDGEYIWLGTYNLAEDDCIYYHVSAETGQRLAVGFAKPGQERPNPTYNTISNVRQGDEKLEVKSGAIVWGVKSGEYSLFIHTKGGTLAGVKGYVTIIKANAD